MKGFWRLSWVAFALVLPAQAAAQVTVPEETPVDVNRTALRNRQTVVLGGRGSVDRAGVIPEFHVVATGDTLWDITGYYFGNPWRWPQVWARNPQVTNPHWIFPGDQVRLLLPGEVGIHTPARAARGGDRLSLPPARYPRGTVFLREEAWATPEDISAAGAIVGSPEDNMLLSEGDQVYIEFRRRAPNVGESYSIFQEGAAARASDRDSGRIVRILGTLLVDAWDNQRHVATARIIESIDPIERGERVAFLQRQFQPVPPRTNERDLLGHIVATPTPRTLSGSQYVVIIDRGQEDGLLLGNRFFLTRRGDPWIEQGRGAGGDATRIGIDRDGDGIVDTPVNAGQRGPDGLPAEVWGELIVVALHPRTCVALVNVSSGEIELGDAVVLRRGY
ncbi:MAG: LysM peptidoglycan-binding domain-containing protein [Deltaproteobacteria bacterium]|nr:LysM peptidoglycan-binding domain-containing protein [Deltaproteobacteria bacterium]